VEGFEDSDQVVHAECLVRIEDPAFRKLLLELKTVRNSTDEFPHFFGPQLPSIHYVGERLQSRINALLALAFF